MRRIIIGLAAVLGIVAWVALDASTVYRWGKTVKDELKTSGFEITAEHRVGDLTLPWTWFMTPVKQVNFKRILGGSQEGIIYAIDGYLRLGDRERTEHAAWLRKIDCGAERFAQMSLGETDANFHNLAQIADALRDVEWISRATIRDRGRWQQEWFASVVSDHCSNKKEVQQSSS